ncbi:MAG TPA: aldose epimerase family protein [Rhodopila sp.]|nr:aldose epimerase family protein [Rhodopila sp.]
MTQDAALPQEPFGQTPDGEPAQVFTLANGKLRVRITDYGGRMVSIEAPDRHGTHGHVLLGLDSAGAYATAGGSFGALLGRNANRIARAQVEIDGKTCHLSKNNGDATLHGGEKGFDKVMWTVSKSTAGAHPSLILTYVSPDGDQGFPGEVNAVATYRLEDESLWLEFQATTTKPTVISLSAHPYFNLAGAETGDVMAHEVMLASDAFLPTDKAQIPTGEIRSVEGTPFDFRRPTAVGARIRHADEQLVFGTGYDQCFTLRPSDVPALAARVRDPASGRILEVHSDQPSIQLYTGNKLNGSVVGHGGVIYRQSAGLALEPQGYPDAPHHPNFPSTILRPGETYNRTIRYRLYAT